MDNDQPGAQPKDEDSKGDKKRDEGVPDVDPATLISELGGEGIEINPPDEPHDR